MAGFICYRRFSHNITVSGVDSVEDLAPQVKRTTIFFASRPPPPSTPFSWWFTRWTVPSSDKSSKSNAENFADSRGNVSWFSYEFTFPRWTIGRVGSGQWFEMLQKSLYFQYFAHLCFLSFHLKNSLQMHNRREGGWWIIKERRSDKIDKISWPRVRNKVKDRRNE